MPRKFHAIKYIRRYRNIQGVFWTSFVRLIYVICWRGGCSNAFKTFLAHLRWTSKTKEMELRELSRPNPANNYLLKVNKRNTKKRFEICSNLTIKTLKWRLSCVLLHNYWILRIQELRALTGDGSSSKKALIQFYL